MTESAPSFQPESGQQLPPHIEWVELTLRVDATLTVGSYGGQPSEWMKPGAEVKVHMSGLPDPAQVQAAYDYAYTNLGTQLSQVIAHLQAKLTEVI